MLLYHLYGVLIALMTLTGSCGVLKTTQEIKSYDFNGANQICSAGCSSGYACDYQDYTGQNPTCQLICTNPGQAGTGQPGNCAVNQVCNPITAMCEAACNSDAICNTFFNQAGTCSSSANGFCQLACMSNSDCTNWDSHLTCNNNICYKKCANAKDCVGGQQCLSGICQFPTCPGPHCPASAYECTTNGFCVPRSCGNGPACGQQGFCNNGTSCSCGTSLICTAPETCSASGNSGACQCGNNPSCTNGNSCVTTDSTTQCQCGTTVGLTCGTGSCNGNTCVCGTATCSAGQTCSSTGTCITPSTCGGVPCTGSCVDNICLTGASGDGTCSAACPSGQICFSRQCLSACGTAGNYCLPNETCSNGQCLCGTKACAQGSICAGTQSSAQCIKSQCGDGYVTGSEFCDEGNPSTYTFPACPNGWSSNAANTACEPNIAGAGNGNNGHCATDCSAPCVLKNSTSNFWSVSQIVTALGNLVEVPTTNCAPACPTGQNCQAGACVVNTPNACPATPCPAGQTCSSAGGGYCVIDSWSNSPVLTATQCPNGLGVWVLNGSYTPTLPISMNNSVAIYGGFHGGTATLPAEKTPADRIDSSLSLPALLGQESFSGTILTGATGNAFSLSTTGEVVLIDGFQILNGQDSAIVIGAGVNATLQNLRISGNNGKTAGGAIQNTGTMTLKDSMISKNTAVTQGGAISTTGTSTIERVTFFGNGISRSVIPVPLCSAGGSGTTANGCPTGMTCPAAGGACTGTPTALTCTSTANCPIGMTCPSGTCTGTPTWVLNNGGAISATGAAALNVYASKFNANYAYGNGGAIYSESQLTVVSSLFTANRASNGGGGLYLSKSAGASAKLYNLTLVDNSAFNIGGGGIYDEGTGSYSVVQSSLFRDNKGLYPFNSNSFAEWAGNRDKSSNFWHSQINSISTGVSVSTLAMSISSASPMTPSYVDMCPVMAYNYGISPSGSPAGLCDGTQTCGALSINTGDVANITFNTNATASNTCDLASEFLDCTAPLYRNCSPMVQKRIPGTNVAPPPYSKDIIGASNASAYQGAYQVQCVKPSDCPSSQPTCSNGACVQ